MLKSVWKFKQIMAKSHKTSMDQTKIIDTFGTYQVHAEHQSLKYLFTQPDPNLRQQRRLETIADFNMDISYTLGKANVMADALSRKAYCSELEVQIQQPLLYEEFRELNIEMVPQGHVNSLVIEHFV